MNYSLQREQTTPLQGRDAWSTRPSQRSVNTETSSIFPLGDKCRACLGVGSVVAYVGEVGGGVTCDRCGGSGTEPSRNN